MASGDHHYLQKGAADLVKYEECVLFGFPGENKIFKVINFCVLIAKYYIYSKINQQ